MGCCWEHEKSGRGHRRRERVEVKLRNWELGESTNQTSDQRSCNMQKVTIWQSINISHILSQPIRLFSLCLDSIQSLSLLRNIIWKRCRPQHFHPQQLWRVKTDQSQKRYSMKRYTFNFNRIVGVMSYMLCLSPLNKALPLMTSWPSLRTKS